jgi:hypothetical protein
MSAPDRLPVAEPPKVAMSEAARAPIGPIATSKLSKWLDTIAVIIAPILVPAGLLAIVRSNKSEAFFSGLGLGEIAFGIVAVAFAALVRAITGKGDSWKLVAAIAVLALVFETGLAVQDDPVPKYEYLAREAHGCAVICNTSAIRETASTIYGDSPNAVYWIVVLLVGALLCTIAGYAIWSES